MLSFYCRNWCRETYVCYRFWLLLIFSRLFVWYLSKKDSFGNFYVKYIYKKKFISKKLRVRLFGKKKKDKIQIFFKQIGSQRQQAHPNFLKADKVSTNISKWLICHVTNILKYQPH